tara:strand:+ start:1659 stop:1772 length:114 start_codon:yes stop_codon:yes gene_type:complete
MKLKDAKQYPIIWTVYHTILAIELAVVIYLLALLVYK